MRIVITGATGNVGTALLERLAGGGHDLVGVVRRPPEPEPPYDAVHWVPLDLTGDACLPGLRAALEGADAVVHLAWGFQPSHDERHLEELGVGGTRRVLEAVAGAEVPHLVHMSSVGAYSPKQGDRPVTETWPTDGIASSTYSRHKAAAERLLDAHAAAHPERRLTRMRPGIVGQSRAGSALVRYGLPGLVPSRVLGHVPVLPLDRRLAIPVVHAVDVADAFARALETGATGAFNLAAPPAITVADIATVLEARHVQVPSGVVRAAASLSWHARLQPVDPGWIDLAYSVPLLDTGRAERELGWSPEVDALSVLEQMVAGMRRGASAPSPVLRPRSVPRALASFVTRGPVSRREQP